MTRKKIQVTIRGVRRSLNWVEYHVTGNENTRLVRLNASCRRLMVQESESKPRFSTICGVMEFTAL